MILIEPRKCRLSHREVSFLLDDVLHQCFCHVFCQFPRPSKRNLLCSSPACLKYLKHISVPFVTLWASAERIRSIWTCCRTRTPSAWHHTRTHTHTHTHTHTLQWETWLSVWVAGGERGWKMCHKHFHTFLTAGCEIPETIHSSTHTHTHTVNCTSVSKYGRQTGQASHRHQQQNWMKCQMIQKWFGAQRSGPTHCPRYPLFCSGSLSKMANYVSCTNADYTGVVSVRGIPEYFIMEINNNKIMDQSWMKWLLHKF